jgi:carbon storage regulator
MLVLSRQRDETIMIGDDIELTIVDIRGDKVRIGIKAPAHVAVHRKEIYDSIKRENEQAASIRQNELNSLRPSIQPGKGPRKTLPTAARLNDGAAPRSKRESA